MSKNVLIISASLRKNSNSEKLAAAFADGANTAGHRAELISLADKSVAFCKGCLACQKTGECVIKDDASRIVQKMLKADVLVFATPIYFYEMCGQMKTMLDRANPLFPSEYVFRDVYLLGAAADEDKHAMDGVMKGLSGWIACFPKSKLAGTVFGGGVTSAGEIANHPALDEVRKMGASV